MLKNLVSNVAKGFNFDLFGKRCDGLMASSGYCRFNSGRGRYAGIAQKVFEWGKGKLKKRAWTKVRGRACLGIFI